MSTCIPASTDWGCAYTPDEIAALDPAKKLRAESLAWSTLQSLTGYQLAICPIVARPCKKLCYPSVYREAPVSGSGPFSPSINAQGMWVNSCGCGNRDACGCGIIHEIVLPGPIGWVAKVEIDGATLDPSAYRVDNGNRLVRIDGDAWPSCQDMAAELTEDNTFGVTYYQGAYPDANANFAAGKLATEFYKACSGNKCALPAGVTTVTRQGVTMEIQTGLWPNGYTGLREVDAFISILNPYGLRQPSRSFSPESRRARTTTARTF